MGGGGEATIFCGDSHWILSSNVVVVEEEEEYFPLNKVVVVVVVVAAASSPPIHERMAPASILIFENMHPNHSREHYQILPCQLIIHNCGICCMAVV
jgi:hypothetical protein